MHLGDIKYLLVSALRGVILTSLPKRYFMSDLLCFELFQVFHIVPVVVIDFIKGGLNGLPVNAFAKKEKTTHRPAPL